LSEHASPSVSGSAQSQSEALEGTHLMENDDLYFDNQDDDLSIDDQLLGEDGGAEGEPDRGRGDLNIALKKEREEKRLLKEQLAQRERELERREALLSQLGTRRDEPQVDRSALRQTLADSLLERPDEVLGQRDQHLISQVHRMNAPLYVKAAKSDVSEGEYGELYKSRTAFKKTVDAYIQNTVATTGQVDTESLNETLAFLAEIANEGQPTKPSNQAAKDKLGSIVDKGGSGAGRKSIDEILVEKTKLAKTNRREYLKWADSPEGKAILNKALQSGQT